MALRDPVNTDMLLHRTGFPPYAIFLVVKIQYGMVHLMPKYHMPDSGCEWEGGVWASEEYVQDLFDVVANCGCN